MTTEHCHPVSRHSIKVMHRRSVHLFTVFFVEESVQHWKSELFLAGNFAIKLCHCYEGLMLCAIAAFQLVNLLKPGRY